MFQGDSGDKPGLSRKLRHGSYKPVAGRKVLGAHINSHVHVQVNYRAVLSCLATLLIIDKPGLNLSTH